jgi:hypothetical protein
MLLKTKETDVEAARWAISAMGAHHGCPAHDDAQGTGDASTRRLYLEIEERCHDVHENKGN